MKTIDKDNMFQSIWDFPENIIDAFNYINKLLIENHEYVIKRNLFQTIVNVSALSKLIDLEALALIVDDL